MCSDWRSDIVDLTLESDNEDDAPSSFTMGPALPSDAPPPGSSRLPNASTPTSRPNIMSANVPLLRNTPQLPYANSHATAKHISNTNIVFTPPTSSSRHSSAASTSRNSANSYVPVPISTHDGTNVTIHAGRPEKRRKVSEPGGQKQTSTQSASMRPNASATGQGRPFDVPMQQSSGPTFRRADDHATHAQSGPAPTRLSNMTYTANTTNKAPSARDMNAALKTSGATSLLANKVVTDGTRPVRIGRVPSNGAFGLPSPSLTRPNATSTTPTNLASPYLQAQMSLNSNAVNRLHGEGKRDMEMTPQAGSQVRSSVQVAKNFENSDFREQQTKKSYFSGVSAVLTSHEPLLPMTDPKPATQGPTRSKAPSQFSEEEEHLLIFLKEVKQFPWKAITSEFAKDIPGRPYHTLQSRYTSKTNRRDRSKDPPLLKLPPRWASEAAITWTAARSGTASSMKRVGAASSYNGDGMSSSEAPKLTIFRQATDQDQSSSSDSGLRQRRPRRAPPVNYDIRRRHRCLGEEMGKIEFDDVVPSVDVDVDMDTPMRSESPSQAQAAIPATAHVVINEPLDLQFTADDAKICLLSRKCLREPVSQRLPYLASSTRLMLQAPPEHLEWDQLLSRDWQGSLLHVDFSPEELRQVQQALVDCQKTPQNPRHNAQRHLRTVVRSLAEPKRLQLVRAIRRRLLARDQSSVDAFLDDARAGRLAEAPRILRLSAARPQKSASSVQTESTSFMLRQREIGSHSRRGWQTATKTTTYQTRNKLMDTLGPLSSWTGASSDIHTVSWSQDGEHFAAGAVAVTDRDSMQYNRPNNLMFGNLADSTIHELAEHSIRREKTDAGANSTQAMFVTQDPKLYTTVTSVAFAPSGKLAYSAGYDQSVCIWHLDRAPAQPALGAKLKHKGEVEMMVVNNHFEGMLATAAKRTSGAPIKLVTLDEDDPCGYEKIKKHDFHSEKAISRSDLRILPQALQFEPRYGGLLLAGFGANVRNDSVFDITGDLCLWDIETQTQIPIHGSNRNVFDVTFNPNRRYMPLFAAGCVASTNVNRGTRSVIRLYNEKGMDKYTCPLEIECRALDMNDVVWCPQEEHLITAGCTDGRVYVWDMRSPDDPLMTLSHGHSLMPLQDGIHHERTDTGIRFLSWGDNATRLYSGSSDGVVKVWDVTRSTEDTFIKDLITLDSGIMAGAFSPDFSKLVLGEVNGSVNVLDVERDDVTIRDAKKLRYMPYAGAMSDQDSGAGDPIASSMPNSGVANGNYLLQTQQLQVVPMGNLPIRQVVQGINYQGPFDQSVDAPFLREQALEFQLSIVTTPGPQCSITACKDNIVTITSEEVGDSGRSSDRIPDELRKHWSALDTNTRIMPGRSKCAHCSRPARPSSSNSSDASALCERCSFACFRCGGVNPIAPATTTLICDTCAGVWDIGALGYECIQQPLSTKLKLDVPLLRRYGRDMLLEWSDDRNTSFGDEMNALTDYYHSLAIDRPESPPL